MISSNISYTGYAKNFLMLNAAVLAPKQYDFIFNIQQIPNDIGAARLKVG